MVKKLLKQEKIYYMRCLPPVCIVLLGLSIVGRFVRSFEADNWVYEMIAKTSFAMFSISVISAFILVLIFVLMRYYRNIFSNEGYLTLTLPASFRQHLTAKLTAATVAMFVMLGVSLLSFVIFLGNEWVIEIYKAIAYLLSDFIRSAGVHFGIYVVEAAILLLVGTVAGILFYYMCISLGQTFQKRKVLATIAIYYGITFVVQALTILVYIGGTMIEVNWDTEKIDMFIQSYKVVLIHTMLIAEITGAIVISVIMFLVCHFILKRRLNLE